MINFQSILIIFAYVNVNECSIKLLDNIKFNFDIQFYSFLLEYK